jgi:bacteriorhodopsin
MLVLGEISPLATTQALVSVEWAGLIIYFTFFLFLVVLFFQRLETRQDGGLKIVFIVLFIAMAKIGSYLMLIFDLGISDIGENTIITTFRYQIFSMIEASAISYMLSHHLEMHGESRWGVTTALIMYTNIQGICISTTGSTQLTFLLFSFFPLFIFDILILATGTKNNVYQIAFSVLTVVLWFFYPLIYTLGPQAELLSATSSLLFLYAVDLCTKLLLPLYAIFTYAPPKEQEKC